MVGNVFTDANCAICQPFHPLGVTQHRGAPDTVDLFLHDVEHVGGAVNGRVFAGARPFGEQFMVGWFCPGPAWRIADDVDNIEMGKVTG